MSEYVSHVIATPSASACARAAVGAFQVAGRVFANSMPPGALLAEVGR